MILLDVEPAVGDGGGMGRKLWVLAIIATAVICAAVSIRSFGQQSAPPQPAQSDLFVQAGINPLVRFRLFRTDNFWNSLLVDTRDGRVWQVQAGTKDGERFMMAINPQMLAGEDSSNGRFTLVSTGNMFNFILLDQTDGRCWQCQFRLNTQSDAGFWPINLSK